MATGSQGRSRRAGRQCIYCGASGFAVRKGEHIFPDALGVVRTIKDVCPDCNNGPLARIDEHLISSSPIALVAGEILDKRVGWTWDVEEASGRLLLEARPDFQVQSMTLWPQLIVAPSGIVLRADFEEILKFGVDSFPPMFFRKLRRAFQVWNRKLSNKRKGLIFENLANQPFRESNYSYPPRAYAKKSLFALESETEPTFFVGHCGDNDKRRIIRELANLDVHKSFSFRRSLGTSEPLVTRTWDHIKTLRGLTKIGLNLLSDCCEKTEVNHRTFSGAFKFALGQNGPTENLLSSSGFVSPEDFTDLHRDDNGHAARLVFDGGIWRVELSFFGGRVCALARFPGPSSEDWTSCTVGTPLKSEKTDVSKQWTVTKHKLFLPRSYHVSWNDPAIIVPSIELINATPLT